MPCPPRMVGCRRDCAHRSFVMAYIAERERQLEAADVASGGYETERREYLSENPPITFQEYLIHTADPRRP